jgi:mRNA interferase RelE/StbE
MAWEIKFSSLAQKNLQQLDHQVVQRILKLLHERIGPLDNPRNIGEALKGSRFGDFWKYRVGDYRLIASIEDNTLQIIIVRVGHRREVYK